MKKEDLNKVDENKLSNWTPGSKEEKPVVYDIEEDEQKSYIPKAHTQFLEQAGVRVVPISYQDSEEEILSLLN